MPTRPSHNTLWSAVLILLLSLGLTGCVTPDLGHTPTGGNIVWPPQKFTTVKAFAYDCHAEDDTHFIRPDGRLSRGILNPGGASLSPEQIRTLLTAITVPQQKSWQSPCYVPHHAFVFYSADGKIVGMLELCFTCNKHRPEPGGLPEYLDMKALYQLAYELRLPLGKGKDYYRNLYRQMHGQG